MLPAASPLLAAFGVSCTLTIGVPGCVARVTVCRSATLLVPPGGFVLVAGPRGAGRTTLLQCLAGMRPPCAGHLRWRDPPPLRVWAPDDLAASRDRPVRALAEPSPWRDRAGSLMLVDDDAGCTTRRDRAVVARSRMHPGDAIVWAMRAKSVDEARAFAGADAACYWLADGWLRSR